MREATETEPTASRPERLLALTSLRAVAALAIVFGHAATVSPLSFPFPDYPFWQWVNWFFVLSGFVLHHNYAHLDDWSARGRYCLARVARILPVHLATFLLLVIALPAYGRTGLDRGLLVVTNLTLVQSWSPDPECYFSFNSPAWSLSVEVFLYACFPLLVWQWRRAWWVALPLALFLRLKLPGWRSHAEVYPPTYLFEFTLGVAAASVHRWLAPRIALSGPTATGLELLALGLLLHVQLYPPALMPHWALVASLASAVTVLVFALRAGWLSRPLSATWLVVLGEASFALYMVHQVVLRAWLAHLKGSLDPWPFYVSYLVVSVLLALGLWRWLERPARSWIMARWPAPRDVPAEPRASPDATRSAPGSSSGHLPAAT